MTRRGFDVWFNNVVPLVGENRVIAKIGLDMLSRGPHKIGLRSLLEVAGLTGKTIDSYHVSFMIAPRVNAAGRMSTPDIATRLLLADDETLVEEVRALAMQLDGENVRRREEEAEPTAAAYLARADAAVSQLCTVSSQASVSTGKIASVIAYSL